MVANSLNKCRQNFDCNAMCSHAVQSFVCLGSNLLFIVVVVVIVVDVMIFFC